MLQTNVLRWLLIIFQEGQHQNVWLCIDSPLYLHLSSHGLGQFGILILFPPAPSAAVLEFQSKKLRPAGHSVCRHNSNLKHQKTKSSKMTMWADNIKFVKDIIDGKYQKIDAAAHEVRIPFY